MLVPRMVLIIRIMILQMIKNRYECIHISSKWTTACMIHHTCVYIAAWAPGFPARGKGSRAAKAPSPLEYIHMYSVSCMRWSILANAPIRFGECASPFCRMRLSILANVSFYAMFLHSFMCFGHNSTHNAPFYDMIDDFEIPRRDLSYELVKTRVGAL